MAGVEGGAGTEHWELSCLEAREEQKAAEPRQPVLWEETSSMVSRQLSTEVFCWEPVHRVARK